MAWHCLWYNYYLPTMDGGVATMSMGPGFQQPRKYFSIPPGQLHQNPQHQQHRQNIPPQQNQIMSMDPNKDPNQAPGQVVMFDGKRMRKAVHRKTVDYNSAVIKYLEVIFDSYFIKTSVYKSRWFACTYNQSLSWILHIKVVLPYNNQLVTIQKTELNTSTGHPTAFNNGLFPYLQVTCKWSWNLRMWSF